MLPNIVLGLIANPVSHRKIWPHLPVVLEVQPDIGHRSDDSAIDRRQAELARLPSLIIRQTGISKLAVRACGRAARFSSRTQPPTKTHEVLSQLDRGVVLNFKAILPRRNRAGVRSARGERSRNSDAGVLAQRRLAVPVASQFKSRLVDNTWTQNLRVAHLKLILRAVAVIARLRQVKRPNAVVRLRALIQLKPRRQRISFTQGQVHARCDVEPRLREWIRMLIRRRDAVAVSRLANHRRGSRVRHNLPIDDRVVLNLSPRTRQRKGRNLRKRPRHTPEAEDRVIRRLRNARA